MEELAAELAAMRRQLNEVAELQIATRASVDGIFLALVEPRRATKSPQRGPAAELAGGPVARSASVEALPSEGGRSMAERQSNSLSSEGTFAEEVHSPVREFTEVCSHRSSKMSCGPSEADVKHTLRDIFLEAEAEQVRLEALYAAKKSKVSYYKHVARTMTKEEIEMFVDSVMGVFICVNAVFIGLSMDMNDNSAPWLGVDLAFTCVFLAELAFKICLKGFRGQFCGQSRFANIMDASLVLVDLLQLMLTFGTAAGGNGDIPSASLFRLVRLLKLTRIVRLLRTEAFRDLLSMIQGMVGGMTTLGWSMLLFLLTVYMVSLLSREAFGRHEAGLVHGLFSSVPRSMLTTFRCSFGDCTSSQGTPVFEHIATEYGAAATVLCCCFIFVLSIGLFNVISAIFVESTMIAAESLQSKKRRARLADTLLWSTRMCRLIKLVIEASPMHALPEQMSKSVEEIFSLAVPASVIDRVVKDPEAIATLNELEIDPEDHEHLSDILDPNCAGCVGLHDLVDGLHRLRGSPRRSDIVSVDLMVRSIQRQVVDLRDKVAQVHEALSI